MSSLLIVTGEPFLTSKPMTFINVPIFSSSLCNIVWFFIKHVVSFHICISNIKILYVDICCLFFLWRNWLKRHLQITFFRALMILFSFSGFLSLNEFFCFCFVLKSIVLWLYRTSWPPLSWYLTVHTICERKAHTNYMWRTKEKRTVYDAMAFFHEITHI